MPPAVSHLWQQGAELWWAWMWPMCWQASLLIVLVAGCDLALRRWLWPQLRIALWLLVLVKLLLPPSLSAPFGIGVAAVVAPIGELATADAAVTIDARLLLWAWGAGVLLLALRRVVRVGRWRRRLERAVARSSVPESLRAVAERVAARVGLPRAPRLALTDRSPSAAVFGVRDPIVLLPTRLRDADANELECVLLHEFAHVRRRDLWVAAIGDWLCIAYWFHPLVWLVPRRIAQLREICCDATVLRLHDGRVDDYQRALLRSAERLLAEPSAAPRLPVGWLGGPSTLLTRLHSLEQHTIGNLRLRQGTVFAVVVVMLSCVVPMATERLISEAPVTVASMEEFLQENAAAAGEPGCLRLRYAALEWFADGQASTEPGTITKAKGGER